VCDEVAVPPGGRGRRHRLEERAAKAFVETVEVDALVGPSRQIGEREDVDSPRTEEVVETA
jgi:hypothetical protein